MADSDAQSQASTTQGVGSDYTASNSSVRSDLDSVSSSVPMSPGGGGRRSKRRGGKRSKRRGGKYSKRR
jgi:tRNA U34 5-methylaminomethyl-2-thiouridine-forming methyltransferase MnmC